MAVPDPIALTYATFGRPAPQYERTREQIGSFVACAIFVLVGFAITVFFNAFTLFCGVRFSFLGQEKAEFRFLMLFGRVPAIALTLPVLLAYAIWHQGNIQGHLAAALPFFGVWALGAVSIAVVALWQR